MLLLFASWKITKNDANALIDEQVVNEIFADAQKESKVLSMFRRLPNMTSDKTKLRVSDSLPVAYFVDENTNNGRKNLTKAAWKNVFLTAEEIAVIVPIKENVLNDASIDIWAEVRPRIVEAFAKKIDNAIFNGVDKPADWRKGLIPSIVEAGKEVTETGKLYSDINNVMTEVEESGYNVTGLLGGVGLKGKFRMMTDETGQPLNTTEIGSLTRNYLDNGAWDKSLSTLLISPTSSYSLGDGLESNSFANYAYNYLKDNGHKNLKYLTVDKNITSSQQSEILNIYKNYDQIVIAMSNVKTSGYNDTIKLINTLTQNHKNVIVIALDTPYDLLSYNNVTNYICVYGYQKASVIALSKYLNGEFKAKGKSPINENLFN